jgi:hypothetical protein
VLLHWPTSWFVSPVSTDKNCAIADRKRTFTDLRDRALLPIASAGGFRRLELIVID